MSPSITIQITKYNILGEIANNLSDINSVKDKLATVMAYWILAMMSLCIMHLQPIVSI